MVDFYGSSYCFNTVLTRLGREASVVEPTDTFMGGEIFSWHKPVRVGTMLRPVRVAYFVAGNANLVAEAVVQAQCAPPSAPGIGPVP